jgi:hypothetical protein
MTRRLRYLASTAGAAALIAAAVTGAVASDKGPLHDLVRTHVRHTTVNGALSVSNVLRVQSNASVYGHLYAHNAEQIWKGLLVRTDGITVQSGGIKSDSLAVAGPIQAQQATIQGNLQAGTLQSTGAISGTSLTLSQGASLQGKLTANGVDGGAGGLTTTGKLTGNGVDAGGGGLTTSGAITAASLTASGNLSAATLNTTGSIVAGGNLSAANLTVTGNVNFSNATVTGLSLSSLNLQSLSVPSLTLGSTSATATPLTLSANGQTAQLSVNQNGAFTAPSLALGTTSTSSPVLTLNGNGHTAAFGVDSSGNITTSTGLTIAGNLSMTGSFSAATLVGSTLQAPNPSNSNSPGALTLTGSSVTVNGNTTHFGNLTVAGGNDLIFSTAPTSSGTAATHILRAGDLDVAGTVTVTVSAGNASGSQSVTFAQPYTTAPVVTVTAGEDPNPNGTAPKVWVTDLSNNGQYTGFVIHVALPANAPSAVNVPYNYHVIG